MNCKDTKISEMPRACHLHGGDLIPIVQHGKNKAIIVQDLVDLFKRILPPPPPPHPGPHPPFPGPCPDHHGHCHVPPYDPYFGDLDMQILGKVREDAAVAKASASVVEGKLDAVEKTADVALNASHKALNVVKVFKEQINKIQALSIEQADLKVKVLNDRRKIKELIQAVLLLNQRVRALEQQAGIEPSDLNLPGDPWLDSLQDPFPSHGCHHHGHHHHQYNPFIDDDDDDMTSDWVDTSNPATLDPDGNLINP